MYSQSEASANSIENPACGDAVAVGAVMVVGGGISGMQAALDLADSGFKVYLVEEKSAIGGHMAQLDKTFPTNDCSMCIISPKLVEVGRHPNIELLAGSEVLDLQGEAGNFTAKVLRKPRYIDTSKCIGCGDCATACPVGLLDSFEEGLASRRAAYRLYSQAIPGAFAIDKLGVAPCRNACPAEQRAQGYIALIAEGRYREALRVIKEDNPFPSVCGRTCHHPCEGHCSRALIDEPVSIMALKRFVVDYALAYGREPIQPVARTRPEWIAIVGAGPSGLTAAQDLVKMGYGVTVYEALPVPGGMMRVGIPAHRLPKGVLQQDIDDILALGVFLKTNTPVSDPAALLAEGYNAVCLATGVSLRDQSLGIEGQELEGVMLAATFLRNINLGQPVEIGNRVAVVGGGVTALDAAAVARRLGIEEVNLVFSRSREELIAYQWEMAAVESEGVRIFERTTATRVLGQDGKVVGLECASTKRGQIIDELGRRRPKTEPGTEFILDVDTIIWVIGQLSDLCFLEPRYDELTADPDTLASEIPGLFVVGGRATSVSFIIEAVALGHRAATSIDRYLRGEPLKQPEAPAPPVAKFSREELLARVQAGEIEVRKRIESALLPMEERVTSFREVVLGLTEKQARAEARRCLQCGVCSECLACVYACQADAVVHDQVAQEVELQAGAVILAPGYEAYHAELSEEYGFGRYPNVVTSLQFERLLSASGPTFGHVERPSDGRIPKKIAFLQCVGSRDQQHDYCSAVCCMYAAKEAVIAVEHEKETQVHVFMMDMRVFSKGYQEYYDRAREKYGVKFTRCRISAVREEPESKDLLLRYQDEAGDMVEERFELVVLSVGMEMAEGVRELGRRVGVELDDYGFCRTAQFQPLQTSKPGVYAVGPFHEPKDIPESVVEASGAAAIAAGLLAGARGTLTQRVEYPPERDVSGEEPKIGVFVCHCGRNIGGYLDVPDVAEYARTLPHVAYAEDNLYSCSQDSIARITEKTAELGLNRVVVASCTPLTHEPLFQDSIRAAGLNPYLFEMANIRNQCSWVHSDDWEVATEKAKKLVQMAVAKAARLSPLHKSEVPVTKRALVIGGGPAGMNAALALAGQGIPVTLVERERELGGNLLRVYFSLDEVTGEPPDAPGPQEYLRDLIERVEAEPLITLHRETELVATGGYKGNFTSTLRTPDGETTVQHGATIIATGGVEYKGDEYGYGTDPRILTQQEFEQFLASQETGGLPNSLAMILCVGPAEQYCGRICCTTALKNALKLKELKPEAQVVIFYKDIRAYGFKERLYTKAREKGVLFVHYDDDRRPEVTVGEQLEIKAWEPSLREELALQPDLLVLSTPLVPAEGTDDLVSMFKVSVDLNGFFMEAHVKLRPVDFASEGLYMAGAAHYPKLLDETITQAQAAAARAALILTRDTLEVGGIVSQVDPELCVGCLTCVRVCPFGVPEIRANLSGVGAISGAAYIEPAMCQGCGICAAECPAQAIQLAHYQDEQMEMKISVLLEPEVLG